LDGWLGELGRKNLLLLAASPASPAELGEFGDFGDWKPKIENWKLKIEKILSLSKPATTTKKILFIYLFFASARTHTSVRADAALRPRTVKTRPRVKPHPRGKRGRARTSGR
jgi:hypothetical protein